MQCSPSTPITVEVLSDGSRVVTFASGLSILTPPVPAPPKLRLSLLSMSRSGLGANRVKFLPSLRLPLPK